MFCFGVNLVMKCGLEASKYLWKQEPAGARVDIDRRQAARQTHIGVRWRGFAHLTLISDRVPYRVQRHVVNLKLLPRGDVNRRASVTRADTSAIVRNWIGVSAPPVVRIPTMRCW